MQQERLFRLAVEAGHIQFTHEPGLGWRVWVTFRRGDELWSEAAGQIYEGLSTAEMLDVIYASLDSAL